jgi:hypothetical protein
MDILWNNPLTIYWKLLKNKFREQVEWHKMRQQMKERQKLEVLQGGKK